MVGTSLLASVVVRAGSITLENVLLEVGEALISAVVISFVIGVAIARAESRRVEEDAKRAEVHEPRSACPLDVHNLIKGAQLRLAANATVRTYGIEVREVIDPRPGGDVTSDLRHRPFGPALAGHDGEMRSPP